jgi:hypothetical protein
VGSGGGGYFPNPGGCTEIFVNGVDQGNTCGNGPQGDGGSGGGGGNSTGGILSRLKNAVSAVCSVVPDASTLGGGVDYGYGVTGGVSGGIVANGELANSPLR